MSFRPRRGTDREGTKGTPDAFPEMEDFMYSPKKQKIAEPPSTLELSVT